MALDQVNLYEFLKPAFLLGECVKHIEKPNFIDYLQSDEEFNSYMAKDKKTLQYYEMHMFNWMIKFIHEANVTTLRNMNAMVQNTAFTVKVDFERDKFNGPHLYLFFLRKLINFYLSLKIEEL